MKQKYLFPFTAMLLLMVPSLSNGQEKFTSFVSPFIGTSGHGHTFPGACLPFGMVQLSPDTDVEGWDWCSGYHASDRSIMGFSHTHLSGTGAPDLGDILIMPETGEAKFEPGDKKIPGQGYHSRFSHTSEVAKPGYYAVKLEDCNVYAEMTTSLRVGFHRYTFQSGSKSGLIFDLGHGIGDKPLKTFMKVVNDSTIVGYRTSTGFIKRHTVFFCAKFSKPIQQIASFSDGRRGNEKSVEGKVAKAVLYFDITSGEKLLVKVGLSTVSEANAMKNIEFEVPHWNFDKTVAEAAQVWEKELSKIEIETKNAEQKATFYTAFYHSMVCPNLISDVDGSFQGWDGNPHQDKGRNYYTNFSLWDTYRALHPLLSLLYPEKNLEFVNSMLERYKQIGSLPMIEYGINETYCMIGYHSIPVISQAILQDQHGFDYGLAFKAMKATAMSDTLGLVYLKKMGYIPSELESNSVSKLLEYAYDDWCIAQVAQKLGKMDDYVYFKGRAQNFKNQFDKSTGFMRGRLADGNWRKPFDPKGATVLGNGDFTEGNSWQYSFYVPQDVTGLIKLMGGDEQFCEKLDSLFSTKSDKGGPGVVDITGLIGQYAHGNEPSHHTAYLYNFAGQPWKTQQTVNTIKGTLYNSGRDGLCGNDDCGQMSAWQVFSSLGFYPVTPGIGYYVIGTPSFKSVRLNLPDGKIFTITALEVSGTNYYIQSAKLNGKSYSKSFILEKDILKGGTLGFRMGDKRNVEWGNKPDDRPVSKIAE